MAASASTLRAPTRARSHRYYLGMAIGFAILLAAAFTERYHARLTGLEAATPLVHLHAAVFVSWFALLLAQTSLVVNERRDLHRRLGIAAVALIPIMLVVGIGTAIDAARHGWNPAGMPDGVRGFLALGIADTLLFTAFASAAIVLRARPEAHKRLIVLASVSLLWAAVSRLPIATGIAIQGKPPPVPALAGVVLLFVLLAFSGPLYDLFTRRRIWRLEILSAMLIVATRGAVRPLAGSEAWQTFSTWLLR
jgi:hypothetical protein